MTACGHSVDLKNAHIVDFCLALKIIFAVPGNAFMFVYAFRILNGFVKIIIAN